MRDEYRAFYKEEEIMCHVYAINFSKHGNEYYIQDENNISWEPNNGDPCTEDEVIVTRFIGLLDKNEKKIWGGDIVQTVSPNGMRLDKFVIFWDNETCSFKKKRSDGEIYNVDMVRESQKEIIGNKFENPELLEEQK